MTIKDIPHFEEMSVEEKLQLIVEIEDSIFESKCEIPVLQSHITELNSRVAHFRKNPDSLISWDELQQRIALWK